MAAVDACPGILALHPARDGHVARIRLPGGYVTRAQWDSLAELSIQFGDGRLDLTARGNIQLRGLAPAAGPDLGRRAVEMGLLPSAVHDRSRNITGSPLAGLAGRPSLLQLVRALDAAIVADPLLATLPGRFVCAVDDGTGGAALARSDIGLRRASGQAEMVVAGRLAGVRLPADAAVPVLAAAARAAVTHGVGTVTNRVADLEDGGACVAAAIGGSLGLRVVADEGRLPVGITAGASSGEAFSAGTASTGVAAAGDASAGRASADGDSAVVTVAAPLGRLEGEQAALLGGMLRAGDVLRLAPAGRIVIPLAVAAAAPSAALARLTEAGLVTSEDDPLAGATACSGTACERGVADVRALARPLPGHPLIHWVACPRGCGRPADAGLVVAVAPDRFSVAGRPAASLRGLLASAS